MSRRAWVASTQQSQWHACDVSDAGGSLVMACGNRLYEPFHRRIGIDPPTNHFAVCQACAAAVHWQPTQPRPPHTARPLWPTTDPDDTNTLARTHDAAALAKAA
ncbi:hypothetical protein [Saccharopolyspora phatthalungensis]|uniref:Uncharacterized protein n=1 Tax=Saccharopolyspora phatthalungensis TaxID=664693 RepID=A0A840PXA3_9PSEU|nr:hypothetical protein [Saccharopolyspora phatthalungensis]MBB5154912.1 hypothetical protein [Saccharopolyspora phatthalungensis]